jgi:hypothetical protein
MRHIWTAIFATVTATACTGADSDEEPVTAEQSSAITEIFRETFEEMMPGPVDGQNGWVGSCTVAEGGPSNRFLKCTSGAGASKTFGTYGGGSYTLLVDIGTNANVVDSTHGKFSLEGPQGRVFQIITGCDNIRVAFQMNGPVATLASFPCGSVTGPGPSFRVVCNWSNAKGVLSCGAARKPADPTTFVDLIVPAPFRPFNTVAVSSFALPGAMLVDNIYIWEN